MIGKILLVPFRIIGGSTSLVGNMLKLVFLILFGTLKFLFKNSIGVAIGVFGGFFVAKKVLNESECTCSCSDETPVDDQNKSTDNDQ